MCKGDLPLARSNERRSTFPSIVTPAKARALAGKLRHEPLKCSPELLRVEPAEQATEGVMAGQAIGKLEETAQERLLRPREQPHINCALPTTQHGAQSNHQQLIEVMQSGIPGSRVLQLLPACGKLLQDAPPRRGVHADL
jgi:hypothetical protein